MFRRVAVQAFVVVFAIFLLQTTATAVVEMVASTDFWGGFIAIFATILTLIVPRNPSGRLRNSTFCCFGPLQPDRVRIDVLLKSEETPHLIDSHGIAFVTAADQLDVMIELTNMLGKQNSIWFVSMCGSKIRESTRHHPAEAKKT